MQGLKFGNFNMKRKTENKYLGHILHEDGLASSVSAKVKDRTGRFKGAIFEVRSIIEDFSLQTLGSMEIAKILLERALLPFLLYGASRWIGIDTRTEDQCDDLLFMDWRVIYSVPDGTPKNSLLPESGTNRTKWRMWIAKIELVNRIYKEDPGSLARRVYKEQLQQGWPGLATEVVSICKQVGIPEGENKRGCLLSSLKGFKRKYEQI